MNEVIKIFNLAFESIDPDWTHDALVFLSGVAALPKHKRDYVALCINADGTPQSWRNMNYRTDNPAHELRLPPGVEVPCEG